MAKDEEEKEAMMERATTPTTRPEKDGTSTVVGDFRDCGFFLFQFLHPANFVAGANPGYWNFYRTVFGERVFLYSKSIKYKILSIAHKNIFSKRIWGAKKPNKLFKNIYWWIKKTMPRHHYRATIK